MRFPNDPRAVLDVKRDLGAVGDGVADDTDALQQAIETAFTAKHPTSRIIYLPAGTYRITRELVFRPLGSTGGEGSMIGPWLFGEDRDRTVIRLDSHAEGFNDPASPRAMIRSLSRPAGAKMNADFFDRMLVNLTIDSGDNGGAIAVQFYSNNTGEMRNVSVRGNGVYGLDLGSHDQNGPLLIENISITGFKTGINFDYGINSQTLSGITIDGAEVGIRHRRQIATIENLTVRGARVPVHCREGGTLTLIGARFVGGPGTGRAIQVDNTNTNLYARNIETEGYARAIGIADDDSAGVAELQVKEFSSAPVLRPNPAATGAGLFLDLPRAPEVPWEADPSKWVCANDFGMTSGPGKEIDADDDGLAIQKAIDHAAATGATTVYIIGGSRAEPNWFHVRSDVRVHGSVRRIIGLGFVRLLFGHQDPSQDERFPEQMAKFIVDDEPGNTAAVAFERLQVFAARPGFAIEVRARQRPVVVRASTPVVIARSGSQVFMLNNVGTLFLEPGAKVVARHQNTEGRRVQIHNRGGELSIVGFKTEKSGTKLLTTAGGRTEVFGALIYNNSGDKERLPCIEVRDASLFSGGFQEVHFGGNWYETPVRLEQGGAEHRIERKPWMRWSAMRAGE